MMPPSLYERILGRSIGGLSPVLERIHDARSTKRYVGRCDITGGEHWIAKAIARFASLPVAKSDVPLEVTIDVRGDGEQWTRTFGAQRMRSVLREQNRQLQERLGLVVLTFALTAEAERIVWSLRNARLAFMPVPIIRVLKCAASETIENGKYCFDVSAHVRGIGLIVHYKGWLVEA
jgi:hypothetical protein